MIDRHSVIEYLNRHPSHSTWQMRLHFLQATRRADGKPSVSIGTIANQLNYILRDLEVTGKIVPPQELAIILEDSHRE
ncbi:MAG: hypothetical protein RLZZ135_327 [Cyanobacteriota bacterium]